MSVNNFDVLKEMGRRNGKIQMAPLGNICNARATKKGTQLTIGVPGNIVADIIMGKFVGGLVLADKEEFDRVKAELEAALLLRL